jgi:hypothetical protein
MKDQLALGIKVELEHSKTIKYIKKNPKISTKEAAEMIAKDHLKELPDYYTRLIAMEKTAKKEIIERLETFRKSLHEQT